MANKLIQQPDILSLDTLGSFMDAQNDPIPTVSEEKEVVKADETTSDTVSAKAQSCKSAKRQADECSACHRGWLRRVGNDGQICGVLQRQSRREQDYRCPESGHQAGLGHHPHQLPTVQLRQHPQRSMPHLHRAQQGADSADAEGEGRYSLRGSFFHRVTKSDTLHAQFM